MPMELKKEFETRLTNIKNSLQDHENSCLILTPGPNLRYLTGYKAKNLERLTCLLVYRDKSILIVPELERLAAIENALLARWPETRIQPSLDQIGRAHV